MADELQERIPPFWGPVFSACFAAALAISAGLAVFGDETGIVTLSSDFGTLRWTLDEFAGLLAASAIGSSALRWLLRRREAGLFRLGEECLELPGRWRRAIPYERIDALQRTRLLGFQFLVIGCGGSSPRFVPGRRLVEPEGLKRLREGILHRIHLLPGGERRRSEVERNSRTAEASFGRAPWLTLAFVTSLVLVYTLIGAGDQTLDDGFPFANVPGLVARGELFRLVTASWGHTSLDHLRANSAVLLVYGWVLEPIVGRPRMLLIGFASAVLASLSFVVASPTPFMSEVGSSPWALGWIGCGLALRILRASSLPPVLRMRAPWAGTALFVVLQLGSDEMSLIVLHAMGLAVGVASAHLLVPKHTSRAPEREGRGRAVDVAAKASLVVIACAFGWAWLTAALRGEGDRALVTKWVLEDATVDAAILNDTAWAAAIDPHASPERLALAERSVARALELEPESAASLDTLATVLYRRGELDRAVEIAWKAVERRTEPFGLEQAARFELARQREQGVLRNGAGSEGEVELEWVASGNEPARLRLRARAPFADGLAVHAVAVRSGTPAAHVRAWIGRPLDPGEPLDLEIPAEAESAFPGAQLVLTRIEVPSGAAAGEVRTEIHAFQSLTAGLP